MKNAYVDKEEIVLFTAQQIMFTSICSRDVVKKK